jgi:hypothetical protein
MVINDLLAIFSVIGNLILLFGSFSNTPLRGYGAIGNYSILGLIFGGLFQISMAITGTTPERIGALLPMTPLMVNGLFGLSLLMLIGRWWLRRMRFRFR